MRVALCNKKRQDELTKDRYYLYVLSKAALIRSPVSFIFMPRILYDLGSRGTVGWKSWLMFVSYSWGAACFYIISYLSLPFQVQMKLSNLVALLLGFTLTFEIRCSRFQHLERSNSNNKIKSPHL